jgi:hypothetical protein
MIKIATREQHPVTHPELDYPGPDILVFRGESAEIEKGPVDAGRAPAAGSGKFMGRGALEAAAAADVLARDSAQARGGQPRPWPQGSPSEPLPVFAPGSPSVYAPGPPSVRARNAVVMSNGELDWARPETWTGMIDRCGGGWEVVSQNSHCGSSLEVIAQALHEF